MKKFYTLMISIMAVSAIHAQSYTSFLTPPNAEDVETQPEFGICLMGGAGESDEAMTWFLERANGGDVVVLRASGSDGYNDYMYSDLGVTINSVETIVFNSAEASNDPYVIEKLNNAEAIWMAGGDQYDYIEYWKGTPVEEAINNLINVKQGPVGGISAGMAVMGQAYFSAENGTITSENAMANPYAPQMTIGWNDFIEAPYMENVITETHFNDPDRIRYGRVSAFMARLQANEGIRPFGMASNEYCAIAIDENGLARAFGEFGSEYPDDYVYFLQANCQGIQGPEIIEPNQPLTWVRDNEAIKVYQVPATIDGTAYFDLNNWNSGEGGSWENWYVDNGELSRVEDAEGTDCTLGLISRKSEFVKVYPNPTANELRIDITFEGGNMPYTIQNAQGQTIAQGLLGTSPSIDVSALSNGIYTIAIQSPSTRFTSTFVKIQ
jgi:cyanophycinase-like exopeptidase